MPREQPVTPSYRLRKPSGQAFSSRSRNACAYSDFSREVCSGNRSKVTPS